MDGRQRCQTLYSIAALHQKQSHNTQFLSLTVCVNFFQEMRMTKYAAEGIKHIMNSLQYTYSIHVSSSQLLNVSSHLKSTQVDVPLSSQVKSSRMCSSRPPSTWGHFSLKSGHVSVPQRLANLVCLNSTTWNQFKNWLKRQLQPETHS